MSDNFTQDTGDVVVLTISGGASSGDPVAVGQITGVSLVDITAGASGAIRRKGVATLSVKGVDGSGNSAVAIGDALYFTSGDTPKINKKTTGVLYGYALAEVTTGSTASISVLLKG